ncbi:hypothetical protein [uncultured Campylobacter sp.]|uniref:hypothetical protein n=1 Tax=uncultured Campylobacter sp. TaxID=218934 RepID=UPI002624B705|nr:hypothetical protein [uncultured Campylobacter sp.]
MRNDEIARFGISKTRYDENIKDFLQDKNCDKRNLAGGGLKFTSDGRRNSINVSERNFTNVVEQKSQSNLSCAADMPSQNFKTQVRNYDKEPIIIKDHAIILNAIIGAIYIVATILMAICGKFSAQQILFLVLLDCYFPLRALNKFSNFGKCYICFKNDDITLYSKKTEAVLYETKISDITCIKRTTGPSYPEISKKTKCLMLLFAFIYLLLVFFVAVVIDGREENFWIIFAVIISISFFPLLLYRLFNGLGFDIINDSILIYDKNSFIEASFLSSKEYRELKAYFLFKTGKNLDKIPPQIFV